MRIFEGRVTSYELLQRTRSLSSHWNSGEMQVREKQDSVVLIIGDANKTSCLFSSEFQTIENYFSDLCV